MCQEAVCTVLYRASSEPWFLKQMFLNPERTFRQYDLTLDEKRTLLSGCIRDIEDCAGKTVGVFLEKRFEEAKPFSTCYDAYFASQVEEREETIVEIEPELAGARAGG